MAEIELDVLMGQCLNRRKESVIIKLLGKRQGCGRSLITINLLRLTDSFQPKMLKKTRHLKVGMPLDSYVIIYRVINFPPK